MCCKHKNNEDSSNLQPIEIAYLYGIILIRNKASKTIQGGVKMSIHNAANMEYYYLADQEPAWMRTERYDYCEPATDAPFTLKGIINVITRLFA